jgi:hypothetical protein
MIICLKCAQNVSPYGAGALADASAREISLSISFKAERARIGLGQ